MGQGSATAPQFDSVEGLVRTAVEQYRSKLLDLSSRNPLVNFRHSERSRSHVRLVNEIPEILFSKLEAGRELSFEALPDPVLIPDDESGSWFETALRKARRSDENYQEALTKLGPSPSERQKRKLERQLRDRLRVEHGLRPFIPVTDPPARARELGIDPSYDLPRNNGQTARHFRDLKVQTLFYRDDLDRKLAALRDTARVLLNDAGLNALYCAFGFLEYYESAAADEKRVAPLVFYPVDLERVLEQGEYRYFIRPTNGDIEVNVALAELLRRELALELPAWNVADDDESPLESYFSAVETIIKKRPEWAVRRYVTVGLFTFSTLVMYKDLEQQKWSAIDCALEKHDLLRTLVAGAEVRGARFADDYEIDQIKDSDVLLATDADTSQHSAIVDVLKGKSCVIQGPPGTGKSQTITNMIAAALSAGKSVLFVAEKMAALEVVAKRLRAVRLEQFCLELHSTKTSKSAVLSSLASRIEYNGRRAQSQRIQSNLEALERARKELIYYVQKTNEAAGQTGLTVHEILLGSAKREVEQKALPSTLRAARFSNAINLTQHQRAEMLAAAATLEAQMPTLAVFGRLKDHPWRGFQNSDITNFETDELLSRLSAWQNMLEKLSQAVEVVGSRVGSPMPPNVGEIQAICDAVLRLPAPGADAVALLLSRLERPDQRKAVSEIVDLVEAIIDHERKLGEYSRLPEAMLSVGSSRFASIADALRVAKCDCPDVASLNLALSSAEARCKKLSEAQSAAKTLLHSFTVKSESLDSVRAVVLGSELLAKLPRDHWFIRSAASVDERNAGNLKTAEMRRKTLSSKRAELDSRVDLAALPPVADLSRYGFALKTTNALMSLFNRDCREAKKIYRFVKRGDGKKVSRLGIAEDFRQCAQYITDESQFLNDKSLRSLAGDQFDGLKTPFSKLLEVNAWATNVSVSLGQYGEAGEEIRQQLFTGKIEQLDTIMGHLKADAYSTLHSVLTEYSEEHLTSLGQLEDRERLKIGAIQEALVGFGNAEVLDNVRLASLSKIVDALKYIEEKSSLLESNPSAKELLPWSDRLTERIEHIKATLVYATRIANMSAPTAIRSWLFSSLDHYVAAQSLAESLVAHISRLAEAATRFDAVAKLDVALWCGKSSFDEASIGTLINRCRRAHANSSVLRDYVSFLLAEDNASDNGLGPVLNSYLEADVDYAELADAADFVFYRSAAEQILNGDSRLKRHSGATHEQLRRQYRELDREFLDLRTVHLSAQLMEREVPGGNYLGRVADLTELALVQHLSGQTRPRIAIRELFRRASKAIQALKPCWMMSPMSVAQFLQPGAVVFDLVVMDEASQIRPEEALGSIVRGKQLVVVGDQMQLPPTPFFQKLSADGNTDSDDEEAVDVKQESVLEAAAARFYPARRLKWHYRSEHGSLIAFSNHEFYDDDLTVFPSPHHDHPHYGVKLVQVAGVYSAGINDPEVKTIVEAAAVFMADHPEQSLGIVAVNSKQADLIRERMDRLFAENPRSEAYRAKWDGGLESFFVKNLENVQGDERDAIFISTVYGPDANGNFYQRFGPINSEYGHRRLNVLFTRAKKRVVLFTSMKPEEIQDEGKNWGVRALKGYIQFARDGHAALPEHGNRECDSEFEKWVLEWLRAEGFDAVPQVGFAGYRIDIAVRHPKQPGIFLCAIECDGATYHSARSVRERDRLRQEILERLGWKIYRIWSTDWFRNPGLEMDKLLGFLRKLAGVR